MTLPKRMKFWKRSKCPLTPPSFSESHVCKFSPKKLCKNPRIKVKNMQHQFLNWKWPPPTPWNFSENSSVLVASPVPKTCACKILCSCNNPRTDHGPPSELGWTLLYFHLESWWLSSSKSESNLLLWSFDVAIQLLPSFSRTNSLWCWMTTSYYVYRLFFSQKIQQASKSIKMEHWEGSNMQT